MPHKFKAIFLTALLFLTLAIYGVYKMHNTPLIPRETFFGNPDKTMVRLSPNGKYLTYVAPKNDVLNIWLKSLSNEKTDTCITHDKGRGITNYAWAYDNEHILYVQDKDGDENWRLFSINIKTGNIKTHVDQKNVQVTFIHSSEKHPKKFLIGINNRTPNYHDIYMLDLSKNSLLKVYENNEYIGFMADDDLTLQLAMKMDQEGRTNWYKRDANKWKPFISFSHEDSSNTGPVLLSKDGKSVYMKDSRQSNLAKLVLMDLETKTTKEIIAPKKAEARIMFHTQEKTPVWYSEDYLKPHRVLIDSRYKKDFEILEKIEKGFSSVISSDNKDTIWIVAYVTDTGPVNYYVYDRTTQTMTHLFSNRKALESVTLQPMHPVEIEARDGLKLVSYLTLPEGCAIDGENTVPAVLLVHGGPEARDSWGYDALHQWLANRGYAVLSVNYRGSSGFGKKFVSAGDGEWAEKMHTDLIDAVNWLKTKKIADPQKIAIMGGSYGGYATLVGLTMTPDVFACGVNIVGVSNLITLYKSLPPYWKPVIDMFKIKLGGDPYSEKGRAVLMKKSPINYVQNIIKQLLIGHGANDPRVKQAESDQIVEAMKKNKIPVTYALYPNEGHGFMRPENRLSFYALAEKFLSDNLGGRYQEIAESEEKSTLQIREATKS